MINLLEFIPRKDQYYTKKPFENGVRSCDIGLTRYYGNNPINEFLKNQITKITQGIFNHAFLVGKNGTVIEAEGDGVKVNSFQKYVSNDDGVIIFRYTLLTENLKKEILSFAYAQVGRKYDYVGLLAFILPFLSQDKDKFFCSELVFKSYEKIGVRMSTKADTSRISPADLFYYLRADKNFIVADTKNLIRERIFV